MLLLSITTYATKESKAGKKDGEYMLEREYLQGILCLTVPVQSSAVFPPIASSHHEYETAAGTQTEVQPLSSHKQFQSTPGTSQPLDSANDQLGIVSSAVLKGVSIPKFAGNKKPYETWKAAFYLYVDQARATPEYKLLRLHECHQGEALKVIENLGHSEAVYEAAKANGSMVGNVEFSHYISKS